MHTRFRALGNGPGADPGVQAVSPQITLSHSPSSRLPLLSARPALTFPVEERHRPSVGTKLYCLVTEVCEQFAQGCYLEVDRLRFEPATFWVASERRTLYCDATQATHMYTCNGNCLSGSIRVKFQ